jgi:hypothetical protein
MACKPLVFILKTDCTNNASNIGMNHLLIHNDTTDQNDNKVDKIVIDRTAHITLKQVRTARELCQNGGDKRGLLDVEMMYKKCLKNWIAEDVTTSIATKYKTLIDMA